MSKSESITKKAFGMYKSRLGYSFPPTFNFAMIALIIFALAIYQPITLILTVPFLGMPFFFALEMTLCDGHKPGDLSSQRFFAYFGSYYSPAFYGSFRQFRTFVLSYLFSLAVAFFLGIIYYYSVGSSAGSALFTDFSSLETLLSNNDVNGANELLKTSTSLISFISFVGVSEICAFGFFFTHEVGFYSMNALLRLSLMGAPSRISNSIYVGSIRSVRSSFWKDYWSSLWFFLLLEGGGFALGYYIGTLFKDYLDYSPQGIVGLLGAFLFVLPFLPYFFIVVSLLHDKYQSAFANYSINWAEKTLEDLKRSQKLSEADIKAVEDGLNKAKEETKEHQNDAENNSDSNSPSNDENNTNTHNPSDYGEKK
jgi:hypothetical protein